LVRAAVKCPEICKKRNGASSEWKNKSTFGSNEKLRKMALKARWTPEAEETFNAVIKYLENKWTDIEVRRFVQKSHKIIDKSKKIHTSLSLPDSMK